MRGIGARNEAVAQHRLGYFQQFHQPKNCRCSVVRTYVQRDRLYKYALTPIPREICNELRRSGSRREPNAVNQSAVRLALFSLPLLSLLHLHLLLSTYVVDHPRRWKTSLNEDNVTIIVDKQLIDCCRRFIELRWRDKRGRIDTSSRTNDFFFFFFSINSDIENCLVESIYVLNIVFDVRIRMYIL